MAGPKSILIVATDAAVIAVLEQLLRAGGGERILTVPDAAALNKQTTESVDFILFSLEAQRLPELVASARAIQQRLVVPLVFLVDEATRTELVKRGGAPSFEYVVKPVSSRELWLVIEAAQRIHSLETRMRQIEAKMQEAQRLEGIGVMAGGIAHDFNNLLTGIFGAVSIAQQEIPAGSAVEQRLAHIERAATWAAELCQRLQAQVGQTASVPTLLSLDKLVEDAVKLAQSSFRAGIVLQTGFAGNLPEVLVNEAHVRQVVINLVTNAAEAIGESKGMIRIVTFSRQLEADALSQLQFAEDSLPGEYLVVEVADTGGGVEPNNLTHLFEPAYTTKAMGRGLGLAAAGRIIRKHRGGVSVESTPGHGSVFRVFLPVKAEARSTSATRPPMSEAFTSGRTVLIVDDDEAVRALAKWVVQKAGIGVVTARDGDEALRLFKANPEHFCLVLLDLTMPRMSGVEVVAGLRMLRPEVPVVIMTGHSEEALTADEQRGVAGYIQKPFGPDQLRAVIRQQLSLLN